ncbi:hypothetical protein A2382_03070 [Candidatus Woesebacteria bacterium RIFOXYB1_FULL_38_16]|uniref:Uncharacterized protein n=1 Tax=Candidatus Woesebacteria bacterium RIFOXYB1_FULL_38_16 TaxID=1802538 RepID=A0A1F8CT33_9BACT|nr:MAG: hypothetical protein A2191_00110 [Candidatus Woesebacteria bacterium RIFOXYA1_FULL_38_9]OGM79431.1 MAG: hypothetical protein A2382_03070 [Candidatus Woesebacteria bacterium RIFOXYB1_FULL_38_16]
MKDLTTFLISNITGSDDFSVEETVENGKCDILVKTKPDIIGFIIGKEGKTIKNIRRILAIKASLERLSVNIKVEEK